jgi:TonB family protein
MEAPLNISGSPAGGATPPKLPKLLSEGEHWSGTFFSRMKDFLTERPVQVPPAKGPVPFETGGFGANFRENLKEALRAERPMPGGAAPSPYLIEWKPGLGAFWENLRDFISPPKLPPLKLTSKPAPPPKELWSKDEVFTRAQLLSAGAHAAFAVALMVPLIYSIEATTQAKNPDTQVVDIGNLSDYITKLPRGNDRSGGGGGGGERNPVPASKGRLPKFSLAPQLTPPVVMILNPNPKLPEQPTVVVPPDIHVPQPNLPNYGDPLAAMVTNSGGPGSGGGIGTGSGGGVGSGSGPGVGPGDGGGIGGGPFHVGRDGVGEPVCIYCPNPPYTEEARKAHYQGTVLLEIVVLADGRTTDVRIVRGLGMGLDEKTIETVRTWRWKPSLAPGGRAVAVDVPVEINFHLY